MLRAVIGLFLCPLAQAATFTATQTGNWASTSTWGGAGPPGAGDRAIINCNCTVTIPASTSVTVGDSPAAGVPVVTISQTGGPSSGPFLVNAGTLTLQGDLLLGSGNSCGSNLGTYTMQGDSITQFSSPAATSYHISWLGQNNCLPFPLAQSTATSWAHPAIVQTMPGNVGNNGAIFSPCCDSGLRLAYTKLINLGSSSALAVRIGGDLILNHVLMVGSGAIQQDGANFAFQTCVDYLDIRTPTALLMINWPTTNARTGCNHLNNSVILANALGATTLNLQSSGLTVSDTIFGLATVAFSQTSNVTFKNVLWADPFADITPQGFTDPSDSGFFWDGGGVWANEGGFNTHSLTGGTGSGLNAPNAVQNLIIDGSGGTPGIGDLWVTPGVHYVNRVIMVNGAGNLENGTGQTSTSFGFLNHNSSENSDGGGGASTIVLNEFSANANQLSQATNTLADRNFNLLCPGNQALPYVQQSGLNYDYNWFANRKDPDTANDAPGGGFLTVRPWNASTGHQGSVCDNPHDGVQNSRGTITVSTVTDPTHLILSSTASVSVGDYLFHNTSSRGAFVLAIPSAGHVTIGNDEDGVPGIPAAVAGQSLVIQTNFWSSGVYGSAGKGQHEGYSDPRLINPNVSVENWDLANGGPGTRTNARTQIFQVNGWDVNGNTVTPNPAYTMAKWLQYVRFGVMPTDLAPKGFAHDVTPWAALTGFVVGQSVLDTARHLQICTTAGTSGGSTPTWNDLGGTTPDGSITWTDQGSGIDPGAIAITVYNSPGISGGSVN